MLTSVRHCKSTGKIWSTSFFYANVRNDRMSDHGLCYYKTVCHFCPGIVERWTRTSRWWRWSVRNHRQVISPAARKMMSLLLWTVKASGYYTTTRHKGWRGYSSLWWEFHFITNLYLTLAWDWWMTVASVFFSAEHFPQRKQWVWNQTRPPGLSHQYLLSTGLFPNRDRSCWTVDSCWQSYWSNKIFSNCFRLLSSSLTILTTKLGMTLSGGYWSMKRYNTASYFNWNVESCATNANDCITSHNLFYIALDPGQPDTHACHKGWLRCPSIQPSHVWFGVVGPGAAMGLSPHPWGQLRRPEGTELHVFSPQRL